MKSAKMVSVANLQSEKMAEAAEMPAFNLQLFNDDVEPSVETDEVINEPNEPNDPGTELNDDDPGRNFEKDKAYAEMRRNAEQFKKQNEQMNSWFKEQYGDEFGVNDFESFTKQISEQRAREKMESIKERIAEGVDTTGDLEQLIKESPIFKQTLSELEQFKNASAETVAKQREKEEINNLNKEYGLELKSYEDVKNLPNAEKIFKYAAESGLSVSEAYFLANKEAILKDGAEKVKQDTINKIAGKNHIKQTANGGGSTNISAPLSDQELSEFRNIMKDKTGKAYPDGLYREYASLSRSGKNPSIKALIKKYK